MHKIIVYDNLFRFAEVVDELNRLKAKCYVKYHIPIEKN